jgi:hypothetical protein
MFILEPLENLSREDAEDECPTSTFRLVKRRGSDPLILHPVNTPYAVMVSGEAKRELLRLREALAERNAKAAPESVSTPPSRWLFSVAVLLAFGLGLLAHALPWSRLLARLSAH